MYDEEGLFVRRCPEEKRQGQGLYVFAEEVDTYQPEVQRRPGDSKNKQTRILSPEVQATRV